MKINGKNLKIVVTFNTLCKMEDLGIDISEHTKPMSLLRGFVAVSLNETLEDAGKDIEAHVVNGGDIKEIIDEMTKAMNESGFFRSLRKETAEGNAEVQKVPVKKA